MKSKQRDRGCSESYAFEVLFMKMFRQVLALSALAAMLSGGLAFAADDHHDDHHPYVRHDEWHKGARINHDDWARGERVDYRHYHLRQPPRGYEWREVDGNYVLAAIATGAIATAIVASTVH